MKSTVLLLLFACPLAAQTPGPEVSSWVINPGGQTGYNNILSNVLEVNYSATQVYVRANSVPGYDIGPWPGNPNTPKAQGFQFKITRTPQQNTNTPIATPLGHIGLWSNGVSIFNALDAMSYNNANIWHQNAEVVEGPSFDNCLGHPAPNGEYHNHVNPTCLYDDSDDQHHSPIIGYAFDGFPVYGAYGFANPGSTGGIARMRSSYHLRNITERTSLPNGTVLQPGQYGPAINSNYPLGRYVEDFEYVPGLGDLDEHNGRFCVTPDYPNGIYAYFVTISPNLTPVYPYVLGPTYYGTVQAGNTGPNSGHVVIGEPVVPYNPATATYAATAGSELNLVLYPNPVADRLSVSAGDVSGNVWLQIFDRTGQCLRSMATQLPAQVDVSQLPEGVFMLRVAAAGAVPVCRRFIKQ